MIFFRFLLFFLFVTFQVQSNEQNIIRYIDLDYVFNNSTVGKKITKNVLSIRKINAEKNEQKEKDLTKKKNDILSKKNILDVKEFEKLVINHQKKVQEYQQKRNKLMKELSLKNASVTKNFMKKIDKILLEYANENNIDLIMNKKTLIVSNSSLDISKNILEIVNKKIKKVD